VISTLLVNLILSIGSCPDPYCRTHADTGITNDPNAHCLWWGSTTLTYNINDQGNPSTGADSFTAIEAAWASWQSVSNQCGNFTIQEGARVPDRQIGYDPQASNNKNILVFRTRFCGDFVASSDACWTDKNCQNIYDCWAYGRGTIALTTTTYNTRTGQIYDSDIEFNAANFTFTTFTGAPCPPGVTLGCTATDIQNTATHEVGHYLGLDHTTYLPADRSWRPTMEATAQQGELSKRIVDPGSQNFICQTYPQGRRAQDCVMNVASQALGSSATSTGCTVVPARGRNSETASGAFPMLALLALVAFARRR
jgi:hypothetical protein